MYLEINNHSCIQKEEGNVLFNSDSEKGNLLPPHGLFFPINSKGSFICNIPDMIAHTTTFGWNEK